LIVDRYQTHLPNGELLDTHHPPRRNLDVRVGRNEHRALPAELHLVRISVPIAGIPPTSKVDGVSVLAAAVATILPTVPDPVYRTTSIIK